MLTKIYAAIWSLVAITAAIFFLSGNFTMLVAVAFGFVIFGLVFMGMMAVLPHEISHPRSASPKVRAESSIRIKPRGFTEQAREFAAELFSSDGVEIRKPKYH